MDSANYNYCPLSRNSYVYAVLLSLIIFLDYVSGLAASKILYISSNIEFPISVIIASMIYPLLDIIAEIFGRKAYIIAVSMRIVLGILFIFFSFFIIYMPYPDTWQYQTAYEYILGFIPLVIIAGIILLIISNSINYLVLSYLRKLLKRKFFVIRSFLSSSIAISINAIFLITLLYFDRFGFVKAFKYSIYTAIYEIFFLSIASLFIPFIVLVVSA